MLSNEYERWQFMWFIAIHIDYFWDDVKVQNTVVSVLKYVPRHEDV